MSHSCPDCDGDWVCDRHRPLGPGQRKMNHYCSLCKRAIPLAPGLRRPFITIGVAHACGGGVQAQKTYGSDEQALNLEELLDDLEASDMPCAGCGESLESGSHPFCCPMDPGS